jgi:hypothetical protein
VRRPQEEDELEKERIWKSLSDAGLTDIKLDELPDRIKEAKDVVLRRLSELMEVTNRNQERQAAAYSLATLKKLESTVRHRS